MKYKALLIDDSKPVSYFNKVVLERSNKFSSIELAGNGLEAVSILDSGYTADVIFLDINMPVMNGWQFLEHYQQRVLNQTPIILLLATMPRQAEQDKLASYPFVKGVKKKMLSQEMLVEIIDHMILV